MLSSENESPVLIHIHIPKCGGTSFRSLLGRQLGSHHRDLYPDNTHFVYAESALADTVRDPDVLSISSHFIRTFPSELGGRPICYVTFLRHPLDQFLSYRNHICGNYRVLTDAALLACVPPAADELTSREFARWILTRSPQNANFRENYTTNFLARHVFHGRSETETEYCSSRFRVAQDVLRQFFFVGLTEELGTNFELFVKIAAERGFPLHLEPTPVENVSRQLTDDVA